MVQQLAPSTDDVANGEVASAHRQSESRRGHSAAWNGGQPNNSDDDRHHNHRTVLQFAMESLPNESLVGLSSAARVSGIRRRVVGLRGTHSTSP